MPLVTTVKKGNKLGRVLGAVGGALGTVSQIADKLSELKFKKAELKLKQAKAKSTEQTLAQKSVVSLTSTFLGFKGNDRKAIVEARFGELEQVVKTGALKIDLVKYKQFLLTAGDEFAEISKNVDQATGAAMMAFIPDNPITPEQREDSFDKADVALSRAIEAAPNPALRTLYTDQLKELREKRKEQKAAKGAGFKSPEGAEFDKKAADIDAKKAKAELDRAKAKAELAKKGFSQKEITGFTQDFNKLVTKDKQLNTLSELRNAVDKIPTIATDAMTNPLSAGGLSRTMAKSFGEIRVTDSDAEAFQLKNAGSLSQKATSLFKKLALGTITKKEADFAIKISKLMSGKLREKERERKTELATSFSKATPISKNILLDIAGVLEDEPEKKAPPKVGGKASAAITEKDIDSMSEKELKEFLAK